MAGESSTYLKRKAQFEAILKRSKGPLPRALAKMAEARLTGSTAILEPAESKALYDSFGDVGEEILRQEFEKITKNPS